MAREVEIYRAQGAPGVDAVDEVTIHIRHEMPDLGPAFPDRARAFFASEAAALADAIWVACPGGTVDMLIQALEARRAAARRT